MYNPDYYILALESHLATDEVRIAVLTESLQTLMMAVAEDSDVEGAMLGAKRVLTSERDVFV